jgi:guanylate kinase
MYPIIGLVAPSGAGKSTLIMELLQRYPKLAIVKSFTTRPRRGIDDDLFYEFIDEDQLRKKEDDGDLTHISEYAGNYYTNDKVYLNNLLEEKVGIAALVESGVKFLREAGYKVYVIKIRPEANKQPEDVKRLMADKEREAENLKPDLEVTNSHTPGGKGRAIDEISKFLDTIIS